MPDPLSPSQRHECMSHIRSKNTKPEVKLRKELFRLGYRYRINDKRLAGKPDVVLPKYRTCIFVNGCFWHGHKGCSKYVQPKTNVEFWSSKVANNRERDLRNYRDLESMDWRVIVVWECELSKSSFDSTVAALRQQLDANRSAWLASKALRSCRRASWQSELHLRRQRTSALLEELPRR